MVEALADHVLGRPRRFEGGDDAGDQREDDERRHQRHAEPFPVVPDSVQNVHTAV